MVPKSVVDGLLESTGWMNELVLVLGGDGAGGGERLLELVDGAWDAEDALLPVPELLRRHLQQRCQRRVPQRLHLHHEPFGFVVTVANDEQRHAPARHAAASVAHPVGEAQPPNQLPHRRLIDEAR